MKVIVLRKGAMRAATGNPVLMVSNDWVMREDTEAVVDKLNPPHQPRRSITSGTIFNSGVG